MNGSGEITALLQDNDFVWAIRAYHPSDQAGVYYADKLEKLSEFLASRGLSKTAPDIALLKSLANSRKDKLFAFLEALVSIRSPEMMAAAWRIIQGLDISEMTMHYQHADTFSLIVELRSPYGEIEKYSTTDIDDMGFVRHLMKSKTGGKPIINGFFALRRSLE